jgi:hypothetical protein
MRSDHLRLHQDKRLKTSCQDSYSKPVLDSLTIYVDRLRGGEEEKLEVKLPPGGFDFGDPELTLADDVAVRGTAYLADGQLIMRFTIIATVAMPCRICNRPVLYHLDLRDLYWIVELADVKGAKVDGAAIVTELIASELPHYLECNEGSCPERKESGKFLNQHRGFHPFEDL